MFLRKLLVQRLLRLPLRAKTEQLTLLVIHLYKKVNLASKISLSTLQPSIAPSSSEIANKYLVQQHLLLNHQDQPTNFIMAPKETPTSGSSKKKGSQTVRFIQQLIKSNPALTDELEDLQT